MSSSGTTKPEPAAFKLHRYNGLGDVMSFRVAIILLTALLTTGCASPFYMGQQPSSQYRVISTHMSEDFRASINTVVIKPSDRKPALHVDGDFEKETPEVGESAAQGAGAGVAVTGQMIAEDPRAIIIAPIILPFAMIVGSITGAAAAKIQQEIQKLRDELTAEITASSNRPLPADVLAESLRAHLQNVSGVEATIDTGEDLAINHADAVLEVTVTNLTILVEKGDATMTTNTSAVIRRTGDNKVLFSQIYRFSQKDSLRNWAEDDYALWSGYVDSAKRNISREISADMFERILLRHVLRPVETESVAGISHDDWNGNTRSETPTLAWELFLLGGDLYGEWVEDIGEDNIFFDLEIYDGPILAYSANAISEPRHDVLSSLKKCKNYSWSVRPVYYADGKARAGEWMRYSPYRFMDGGKKEFNPETQQFWEGFPRLKTRC